MEKLNQIQLQSCLTVTLNCQVDQNILGKNFATITQALRQLQKHQQTSASSDSALRSQLEDLRKRLDKIQKNPGNSTTSTSQTVKTSHLQNGVSNKDWQWLKEKVLKNQENILANIKDINLINKELNEAQKDIQDLKAKLKGLGDHSDKNTGDKNSNGLTEMTLNFNNQLQNHNDRIKELQVKMIKVHEHLAKLDKQLESLVKDKNSQRQKSQQTNEKDYDNSDQLKQLRKYVKEQLAQLDRRTTNLQSQNLRQQTDIDYLKDIVDNWENKGNEENQEENRQQKQKRMQQQKSLQNTIEDLSKRLQELDKREHNDIKALQDELKSLLKSRDEAQHASKTSIQQDKGNRRSLPTEDILDRLNQLELKVIYLEKLLAGSKHNLGDQRNPQRLPGINRSKRNISTYHEKERSGFGKKDLSDLKTELQAWIQSLLQDNRGRQNYQDLEMKIQQIRLSLDKKADGEGTKKGFAFLENKITQLYLFLTEPDSEDAMIVRKGFNCLSCSKKVEKLRGRLGPRVNWNNMTSTNYSPPRVGYSKPMGETDKEDDL